MPGGRTNVSEECGFSGESSLKEKSDSRILSPTTVAEGAVVVKYLDMGFIVDAEHKNDPVKSCDRGA